MLQEIIKILINNDLQQFNMHSRGPRFIDYKDDNSASITHDQ
jgi:hypothetical protein